MAGDPITSSFKVCEVADFTKAGLPLIGNDLWLEGSLSSFLCIEDFENFILEGNDLTAKRKREKIIVTATICRSSVSTECAGYTDMETEFDTTFFEMKAITK